MQRIYLKNCGHKRGTGIVGIISTKVYEVYEARARVGPMIERVSLKFKLNLNECLTKKCVVILLAYDYECNFKLGYKSPCQ